MCMIRYHSYRSRNSIHQPYFPPNRFRNRRNLKLVNSLGNIFRKLRLSENMPAYVPSIKFDYRYPCGTVTCCDSRFFIEILTWRKYNFFHIWKKLLKKREPSVRGAQRWQCEIFVFIKTENRTSTNQRYEPESSLSTVVYKKKDVRRSTCNICENRFSRLTHT